MMLEIDLWYALGEVAGYMFRLLCVIEEFLDIASDVLI